jgi:hypothetical protein
MEASRMLKVAETTRKPFVDSSFVLFEDMGNLFWVGAQRHWSKLIHLVALQPIIFGHAPSHSNEPASKISKINNGRKEILAPGFVYVEHS